MPFQSDNAAAVHPRVWAAMQAADPDAAYDGDRWSRRMDAAFSELFGRECAALWVATGTAANCLGLAVLVPPYGGIVCHPDAHIETSEGGAAGFFTHGAKLMLAEGHGAKLSPANIAAVIDPIEPGAHYVQAHAVALTQASENGLTYSPEELVALGDFTRSRGLRLHIDGARFANAVAFHGGSPAALSCDAGVDTLAFGCVKNGGLGAEALVLFDPGLAEEVRFRRKRAGHLQSKGSYMAAQVLALVEDGLWLDNARAANAAAQEIGAAAGERLLFAVEANEVFLRLSDAERAALRSQGFGFYDWEEGAARIVASWNSDPGKVTALAKAIAAL